MSVYNSKEFKKLQISWYKKLKEEGFENLEDVNENLYYPNLRTIAWRNRDSIREFFFKLDDYLHKVKGIPRKHRNVLKKWSEGIYLVEISKELKIPLPTCKQIVGKYKKIIINWSGDDKE